MRSIARRLLIALLLIPVTAVCWAAAPPSAVAPPRQFGFVAGVLTIPFKFHLNDDTMTGGSTLGGYLGWKMTWMGLTLTPIVSTGMAMPTGNYGPGLTAAGGFIGSVRGTPMDWGLVFGVDWFAKSAHYPYQGKPWLAVEIGYKFAR